MLNKNQTIRKSTPRRPPPNLSIPMCSLHLANRRPPPLPSGFAPANSTSNLQTWSPFQSWKPTTYLVQARSPTQPGSRRGPGLEGPRAPRSERCKLWLPDCRAQVGNFPRRLEGFQGWRFQYNPLTLPLHFTKSFHPSKTNLSFYTILIEYDLTLS